jgi:hypothetical protein
VKPKRYPINISLGTWDRLDKGGWLDDDLIHLGIQWALPANSFLGLIDIIECRLAAATKSPQLVRTLSPFFLAKL